MQRATIAEMLLDRRGDQRLGLRTREADWTWDEVIRESAARGALADELRQDGPFHIGILLDNVPDFVFWLGGAALAGAVVVGINPTRGAGELENEIRLVDCQLIVTDRAGKERLRALDIGLSDNRYLVIDEPDYPELIDRHRVEQPAMAPTVDASSLFLLLFTSGTTGMSKAVKCSQGRLTRLAYASSVKFGHHRDDVDYCCMPLFHGNALMALWAPALVNGATICLTEKFSASRFLDDVTYFGATFFTYVGTALRYVLATPEGRNDADNRLERGFGTEASPEDQAAFAQRFGAVLYEGYGSSEGSGAVALHPDAPEGALGVPAHSGIAVVHADTRTECARAVLDDYGRVSNPDESIGEMVDKHGAASFEGYYNNDAANAERLRHGWYWTGDLGYLDEAGFLYFAGRKGDWIRVDGENISTLTIERVLRRYGAIVSAAVYAVPDPRTGDQVMAAVAMEPGEVFDPALFAAFLGRQPDLGSKAVPRFVRVSSELPVTGSNKVRKNELQAEAWRCADPVWRWQGRGVPEYVQMTAEDKDELVSQFYAAGRQRFL